MRRLKRFVVSLDWPLLLGLWAGFFLAEALLVAAEVREFEPTWVFGLCLGALCSAAYPANRGFSESGDVRHGFVISFGRFSVVRNYRSLMFEVIDDQDGQRCVAEYAIASRAYRDAREREILSQGSF